MPKDEWENNMDKKSCKNCNAYKYLKPFPCYDGNRQNKNGVCSKWLRNPTFWLDITPTETGWYWWKLNKKSKLKDILPLFGNAKMLKRLTKEQGVWQGPICPKNK